LCSLQFKRTVSRHESWCLVQQRSDCCRLWLVPRWMLCWQEEA
jgi:hypothetical protein